MKILILISLVLMVFAADAQRWKKNRYEFIYGVGFTNFLGDLGGGNGKSKPSIGDLDMAATRFCVDVGLRYRIVDRVSAKAGFVFGSIRGDDNFSKSSRTARNLSFRSLIAEFSVVGEYSIIREKTGRRYQFSNSGKIRLDGVNTYLFAGLGLTYFNPKGQYVDGKWYALQPLGTEGQGLPGAPSPYSRIAASFPIGVGFKYAIKRKYNLSIEYGYRFTTTDYMDDASDKYYDNEAIRLARGSKGDMAAYFADPREGTKASSGNLWRGDPKSNDGYMFFIVNLCVKMRTTRKGLPRF